MNTVNIAKTLNLGSLRIVTNHVRVSTLGHIVLLPVRKREEVQADGTVKIVQFPGKPENSIFGEGEWINIQFGQDFSTVRSVVLDEAQCELVTRIDVTSGSKRIHKFFAVRGIDRNLLQMAKFGKGARPETVLSVQAKRATDFVVDKVMKPGIEGVSVWSPWSSTIHQEWDQVGFGPGLARKFWGNILTAAKRMGIEISEHVSSLVFKMPELMNNGLVYQARYPVYSSNNMMKVRFVATDSPLSGPTVSPILMKLMEGDEDGDASRIFTGEQYASIVKFIGNVEENIAKRLGCGLLHIHGLDYRTGSSVGVKGDKSVDVCLQNVTFDSGNLWSDFQGFKTKGAVGTLTTAIWQYGWAISRLLTQEELVQFCTERIELDKLLILTETDETKLIKLQLGINTMSFLVTQVTRNAPNLVELLAQLGMEITCRVFNDMVEHVFDARKGEVLAYDPIENLNALLRTGRFDMYGMEVEGLWVAPLKLVSSRIWSIAINDDGKEYFKYSIKDVIQEFDPVFYAFVANRTKGWKTGVEAVLSLVSDFAADGLNPLVKSLYLQGGFINKPVVEVPEKFLQITDKGELYDALEDAVMGRTFETGPSTLKEMNSLLKEMNIGLVLGKDEEGTFIQSGKIRKFLPDFGIKLNTESFGGLVTDYPGHTIRVGNINRACPPMLINASVNPFFDEEGLKLVRKGYKSKYPGLKGDFKLLNVYGILGYLLISASVGVDDKYQKVSRAAAKIRAFFNSCELLRDEEARCVYGDMITVNIRKEGLGADWKSLVEDDFAVAAYEAGYSLYAVSKNNPMERFLKIDPKLGVPRLVAAYDVFWPLRTARRYDREAVSTARNLRKFKNASTPKVSDNFGYGKVFDNHRQMVVMAFFNSEASRGGCDPVDFTITGLEKSLSSDVTWEWMSKTELDDYLACLDEVVKAATLKVRNEAKERGFEVIRTEAVDDEFTVVRYRVPVEFGETSLESSSFKVCFPGTKSLGKGCGIQLVASYTPLKSYNTLPARLKATGKSKVIMIDAIMPADTIVAKKAWSLIAEAAASQIEGGFVLDTTNPQEIVDRVVPQIAEALEAEGKPRDGKMYVYRLGDDSIEPVIGSDGKVLRAVVGEVPMYRTRFEAAGRNSMTKLSSQGVASLNHMERVLIREVPTNLGLLRDEMAIVMHNLKKAIAAQPISEVSDDFLEGEFGSLEEEIF